MTSEILYYFTRFIHDFDVNFLYHDYYRQTTEAQLCTIMTSKLLRQDYDKQITVSKLQWYSYNKQTVVV